MTGPSNSPSPAPFTVKARSGTRPTVGCCWSTCLPAPWSTSTSEARTGRRELATVAAALRSRRNGGYVLATENRFLLLGPDLTRGGDAAAGLHRPSDPDERRRLRSPGPLLLRNHGLRRDSGSRDPVPPRSGRPRRGDSPRASPSRTGCSGTRPVTPCSTPTRPRAGSTASTSTRRPAASPAGAPSPRSPAAGIRTAWRSTRRTASGWPSGAAVRCTATAATGRLDLVVDLPVSNVTACAFGGPDLRTLFITTSRQGLSPEDQPDAGAVFRYDAGIAGARQHAYAG